MQGGGCRGGNHVGYNLPYVSFFQVLCPCECELEMLVGGYGMFVLGPDSEERGGVYLRERL